ncbi:hypothetical protein ACFVYD_14980 [Streptomyces sp. NPDC058301]|uniref:hypothetical protein n=1 Tax=Streptomyces sp. NPDC058301 TaxID=3346436 RepID=UPI0036EB1F17
MTQPQTLTAGARLTGAVLCAFLAVLTAAWLARDVHAARSLADLWWFWSGAPKHGGTPLTTGVLDLVLLVVYAVAAAVVPRSPAAAAVLCCVGAVTAALRVSSLWVLHHDDWTDSTALHDLHRRALLSTFAALAAGLALVITAAAGRRPDGAPGPRPAARPGAGAALTAFVLLGAAGLVAAAWEIYWAVELPGRQYRSRFSGTHLPLLWIPGGWASVVLAAIALTAAGGGLARAVHVRPLGLVAAAILAASGALGISLAVRFELLDHFGDLETSAQLQVLTWFFQLVAGLLLVPVLARRGPEDPADAAGAPWQPQYPPYAPYSPRAPRDSHGGGFGPPPPGFGPPPPPASPPPGW